MEKKEFTMMTSFGPKAFKIVSNNKEAVEDIIKFLKDTYGYTVEASKEKPTEESVSKDIDYYIDRIAKKNNMSFNKMDNFLYKMFEINPTAVIQTVLREIAIDMDNKYSDHINKCKYVYTLSLTNGKIYKIGSKTCKNFRNFAAFRTEEDAKEAIKILGEDWKDLFRWKTKK